MKKIIFLLTTILMISSTQVYAANMNGGKALEKFARGMTNIVTCPAEYVYQIPKSVEKSPEYFTAFFMDLARGTGYTLCRFGAGVYDVLTCPFPGKSNYEPIMQPETIFKPVFEERTG